MTSKKMGAEAVALRIGSRVRCTDDGVLGKITWANGLAVKVKWDDGETVTWKRDSLATRPIEILAPEDDGTPGADAEPTAAANLAAPAEATAEEGVAAPAVPQPDGKAEPAAADQPAPEG